MLSHRNPWTIVLAAGEGNRLRSLTTANGVAVPKQFCSLQGGRSLLQEALQRAERISPPGRIGAIVAAQHRRWWSTTLAAMAPENVTVQPENRGTAVGVLLPLLRLELRDPQARVVLLPSDHHVRDEDVLARALRGATREIARGGLDVLLLGIEPDEPDPELGYILPAGDGGGIQRVLRFVEKPDRSQASRLLARGAVWNSFIVAARLGGLLALYERRLPRLLDDLRRAVRRDAVSGTQGETAALYRDLANLDFSRDLLQGQEEHLGVVAVPSCGWSDLGTPPRVVAALNRIGAIETSALAARAAGAFLDLSHQHAMQRSAG